LPCCVLLSEHCKMCRRKKEYLTIFLLLTAHSKKKKSCLLHYWVIARAIRSNKKRHSLKQAMCADEDLLMI
jgi:hypothetical protein